MGLATQRMSVQQLYDYGGVAAARRRSCDAIRESRMNS